MSTQIEIMDRKRRRLILFILIGYGAWYGILNLYFTFSGLIRRFSDYRSPIYQAIKQISKYYYIAFLLGYLLCIFLIMIWWLYKKNLKKDPALESAVDNEMVKQNWLKAYKFSFFCIIALLVVHHIIRILDSFYYRGKLGFIDGFAIHYLLYAAVVSCLGAFLFYERDR